MIPEAAYKPSSLSLDALTHQLEVLECGARGRGADNLVARHMIDASGLQEVEMALETGNVVKHRLKDSFGEDHGEDLARDSDGHCGFGGGARASD